MRPKFHSTRIGQAVCALVLASQLGACGGGGSGETANVEQEATTLSVSGSKGEVSRYFGTWELPCSRLNTAAGVHYVTMTLGVLPRATNGNQVSATYIITDYGTDSACRIRLSPLATGSASRLSSLTMTLMRSSIAVQGAYAGTVDEMQFLDHQDQSSWTMYLGFSPELTTFGWRDTLLTWDSLDFPRDLARYAKR